MAKDRIERGNIQVPMVIDMKWNMRQKYAKINHLREKKNTVKYIQNKKKKTNVTNNLNCDVCECKFTRKDNLKRHKINKH